MSDEIQIGDLTFAPGVLETIVTLAAKEVDGVASIVGNQRLAQLAQKAVNKQAARSVEVHVDGDKVSISLHIEVEYGSPLRGVAEAVQKAVSEALSHQVGISIEAIDVYVDAIEFSG